jgi:hypothetical protein
MTVFNTMKYVLSKIDGISQKLGFRNYRAYIVKTNWSRFTIGDGYATTTETEIVLEDGYAPYLQEDNDKTIFSGESKNLVMLGPIPSIYTWNGQSKGYDVDDFICNSKNQEIYIKIITDNETSYWTISRIHESKSRISNKIELTRRSGDV